jgi:hypothetical protein
VDGQDIHYAGNVVRIKRGFAVQQHSGLRKALFYIIVVMLIVSALEILLVVATVAGLLDRHDIFRVLGNAGLRLFVCTIGLFAYKVDQRIDNLLRLLSEKNRGV